MHIQALFFTLRDLTRALSPRGRLVATTLKSYPDFRPLYSNLTAGGQHDDGLRETKRAPRNWATIAEAEGNGKPRFFHRQRLSSLLKPRVDPTPANQA